MQIPMRLGWTHYPKPTLPTHFLSRKIFSLIITIILHDKRRPPSRPCRRCTSLHRLIVLILVHLDLSWRSCISFSCIP